MNTKTVVYQISNLCLLLIIGALPLAFISSNGKVSFEFSRILSEVYHFIRGLFDGNSFYYLEEERVRFFFTDVASYFVSSYFYLLIAGVLVIILSIIFGVWLWKKSEKGLTPVIGFIGMIPDFILVLLLQMLVVYILKSTGIKIAKVATFRMNDPAIALPIISLFILPFVYLVGSLSQKTFDILTESYIRTALSKGLSKSQIYLYHVTTNVLPFLKADLHKVVSIMLGNLFIVEYLYNNKGLTSMLFPMKIGYQYNLFILCFLSFFVLYISLYFTLKVFVLLLERILTHERAI